MKAPYDIKPKSWTKLTVGLGYIELKHLSILSGFEIYQLKCRMVWRKWMRRDAETRFWRNRILSRSSHCRRDERRGKKKNF